MKPPKTPTSLKKKILVVGQTPPPFGGQAVMIQRLLDGHYRNAQLYHVRMAYSRDMDDMGRFRGGKLLHTFSIVLRAAYLRLRHGINVLYYPPAGPDRLPLLRDMAILLSIRWMFKQTIFHFHAAGSSELYPRLPRLLQILYRWSFFNPDLTIKLSEFNPDDGSFVQARRQVVVPNGIEDEYSGLDRPPRKVGSNCSLLFVGVICESKGILVLIEAVRLLTQRGVPVQAKVVGKFSSENFRQTVLQKLEEYELTDRFEFTGVLTGAAKTQQYLDADIFCFPTFFESESFGLAVVEAMQFCIPVIASRWRGVQSLFKHGEEGLLVPVRDPLALADAIQQLVSQPELRLKLGRAGRERFLRDYTVGHFHQRMDACFGSL